MPEAAERGPERGAWGPRDWCASGIGGESLRLEEEAPPAGAEAEAGASTGVDAGAVRQGGAGRGARARRGSTAGRGRWQRGAGPGRSEEQDAEAGPASASPEPPADPVAAARGICLRLLTGQPRTRRQLADALRRRGIPEEAAEAVLSRFEDVGLIDDTAFAAAWVESRHRGRGLARRALERELLTRGVAGSVAAEAVADLDPEQEAATARDLVLRKARATRGLGRETRVRRLVGLLARRGYPEGLAFRVVREVLAGEGEEADGEGLDDILPDA